jgi:hypothetical protein
VLLLWLLRLSRDHSLIEASLDPDMASIEPPEVDGAPDDAPVIDPLVVQRVQRAAREARGGYEVWYSVQQARGGGG